MKEKHCLDWIGHVLGLTKIFCAKLRDVAQWQARLAKCQVLCQIMQAIEAKWIANAPLSGCTSGLVGST
jgi:hypothetical protein